MADPSVTAATCAATVAICVPFLTALGLDPVDAVFAGIGVVCAQTLLPSKEPREFRKLIGVAVGSVLLATVATPVAAPYLAKLFASMSGDAVLFRHVVASCLGACAQPFAVWLRGMLDAYFAKRAGNA